jgi:beta-glucanase (GH16 family)
MRIPRSPFSAIGLLALVWMGSSPLRADPPAGWNLVFSDEFEGQSVDSTKWGTTIHFSGALGPRYHNLSYQSYTLDDDVGVSDGLLHLRTERRPVSGREPAGFFEYSQGLVSTQDKFTFTYGYVEIRAKYPGGKGLWPCFWLMPQDESWPPEFDIAEYYGGPHKMHHGLAYGSSRETKWDSSGDTETEFVNTWHTFGLEWTAGRAVWYVDGVACKTVVADYVPSVPMFVILSNGVSSRFGPSGEPDSETVFPNEMAVDYIRVYQPPVPTILASGPSTKSLPEPAEPTAKPAEPTKEEPKPIIAILPAASLP